MNSKILGRSGLRVSEIGFGGRWLDKNGEEVVRKALSLGINHIDTSGGYGNSEEIIGKVLKETEKSVVLSSKVWSNDEKKIRESLEKSLENLGVSQLDIFLIHNPEDTFSTLPIFKKLKEEGLIKAIGVCGWHGEEAQIKKTIEEGSADILQIAISLAHRGMIENGVVEMAREHNLGIQVMSPLGKGMLADHDSVVASLKPYGVENMVQASLKYLVDHLATGVVLPGTSKPSRVENFVSVAGLPKIPKEAWETVFAEIARVPALTEEP